MNYYFSIAVFTDGSSTVEELLARYNNDFQTTPHKYFSFRNATEELNEKYEKGKMRVIYKGKTYCPVNSEEATTYYNRKGKLKRGYQIDIVPISDVYKSIDELAENRYHCAWNEEEKAWGYWGNINAWFDSYVVGGIFSGKLYSKKENKRVDSVEMQDIDLDKMWENRKEEARNFYKKVQSEYTALHSEEKQNEYGEYIKNILDIYPTEEDYVNRETIPFNTYGVIKPDGVLQLCGGIDMDGGKTATIKERREWCNNFEERFLKEAKEKNWHLTVVECRMYPWNKVWYLMEKLDSHLIDF